MVLLMMYSMMANVLLVNLLVAMMGSTYDRFASAHAYIQACICR